MKLTALFETIADARKLALHLQQLALEHNFEYELEYRPAMHVGTANKIKAIELMLAPHQVKEIIEALDAYGKNTEDTELAQKLIGKLAASIVIGELASAGNMPDMHVFDSSDNWIGQYADDEIEKLVKLHIEPYSRHVSPS